jgi:membrane-associated phospholipid phosphatase
VSDLKASSGEGATAQGVEPLAAAGKFAAAPGANMVRNLVQWCRALIRAGRVQTPPTQKGAIVGIVLGLLLVIAAMFFIDSPARDWARHLPPAVKDAFEQITNAGLSGWWLIPSAAVVLCLAAGASPTLPALTRGLLAALAARFGFIFWAIALPGLFTTIIKRFIGRARPYMDVHGDPFTYAPFAWRPEYASLPSGHAATVASAAVALGAIWPRSRPLMWLYALLIMFSRVVVFAHHPSDVIAGALVGVVGAALVRRSFAARRLVFSPGDLAAYPGPSRSRAWAAIRRALFGPGHVKSLESAPD